VSVLIIDLIIAVLLPATGATAAQFNTGEITGVVRDTSGAAIRRPQSR
jgi:hypothetical protein